MTRRALEITRTERRAATAGAAASVRGAGPAPVGAPAPRRGAHDAPAPDWPRVIDALRATDEDDLPLFGRFPA